jgi:phenylalanyl-tRNA synthetase alpha chain
MTPSHLHAMVDTVLPAATWEAEPAIHPYTKQGLQIKVQAGGEWIELAECGLASPDVLAGAGLDPASWSGLALGMVLDRALMLCKGVPDIRLLRATEPRIAEQMQDLRPWRVVSMMPPVRCDLSLVTDFGIDEELLGDRARDALGRDADILESLTIRAITNHEQLPVQVRERLKTHPG